MKVYNQRDPRWASKVIGHDENGKPITMGGYGCGFTSLAMVFSDLLGEHDAQIADTPDVVFDKLKSIGAVDAGGLIVWNSIKLGTGVGRAYPTIEFLSRDYVESPGYNAPRITSDAARKRALKAGRIGVPALIRVKLGANPDRANHWIVGFLGSETIADPWTGDVVPFRDRYGDPDSQIFGLARLFGKSVGGTDGEKTALAWKSHQVKRSWDALPPDLREKVAAAAPEISTYSREMFDDLTI